MRTRFTRTSAAVLSAALVLAACGGDEEDPAAEGGGEDTAAESESEAEPTEGEETEAEPTEGEETEVEVTDATDGQLQLAYILPETGQLAFLGPPMIAGTQIAVADVNAAGGVLGGDISLATGDEAGDASVASQTASRLLGEGVDAIIGAAASGMSLAIIDQVTGNGVLQCSPSNTSPTFTEYDDNGLYFRTAPPDTLQAPVLANLVIGEGVANPAILARGDDYGNGLANAVEEQLTAGGATVADKIIYDPEAANFDAEVDQAVASGADGVIIIGFEESAQILTKMISEGVGPGDFPVFGADGMAGEGLATSVDPENPGVLAGLTGTSPASQTSADFISRVQEESPDLTDTLFAAESYDCVVTVSLAAIAADSDDPEAIAAEMTAVTTEGTDCSTFEECKGLLEEGEDINYNGVSGPVELVDPGEPGVGQYEVYQFTAEGTTEILRTEESRLE